MPSESSLTDTEKTIVVLNKVTSVSVRIIWHQAPNGFLLVSSISLWGNLPPDSYSTLNWWTLEPAANLKQVHGYVLHDHVKKGVGVVSIWRQQAKSIPNKKHFYTCLIFHWGTLDQWFVPFFLPLLCHSSKQLLMLPLKEKNNTVWVFSCFLHAQNKICCIWLIW